MVAGKGNNTVERGIAQEECDRSLSERSSAGLARNEHCIIGFGPWPEELGSVGCSRQLSASRTARGTAERPRTLTLAMTRRRWICTAHAGRDGCGPGWSLVACCGSVDERHQRSGAGPLGHPWRPGPQQQRTGYPEVPPRVHRMRTTQCVWQCLCARCRGSGRWGTAEVAGVASKLPNAGEQESGIIGCLALFGGTGTGGACGDGRCLAVVLVVVGVVVVVLPVVAHSDSHPRAVFSSVLFFSL